MCKSAGGENGEHREGAPNPANVSFVRARVKDDLSGVSPDLADDVALVMGELLGNAVRHARALPDGTICASWTITSAQIELAVTDGGGASEPALQAAGPGDVGGRGLSIVSCLAQRWGVRREFGGTTVWAQFALGRPELSLRERAAALV